MREFPENYKENFEIIHEADRRAPFFVFLKSLLSNRRHRLSAQVGADVQNLHGKAGKMLELLRIAPMPLRREHLIEEIWNRDYTPEYDSRFYKLIERLRKRGVPIKNTNQTYSLAL
jgi:DNA-binding response OmpR family regulator